MTSQAIQHESLTRATSGQSVANYTLIILGFTAKGISADDIRPRENVFTFNAWKALGRTVRKGEHGIKVCVWVPVTGKGMSRSTATEAVPESSSPYTMPRSTTVFHISQTEEVTA